VAPVQGLVAHGGVAGAIVETFLALSVAAIFLAIYLRERRARDDDDDEQPPDDQIRPQ
jgi:hypothetical protein